MCCVTGFALQLQWCKRFQSSQFWRLEIREFAARSGWGISVRDSASTELLSLPLFLKVPRHHSRSIQLSPSFFSVIEPAPLFFFRPRDWVIIWPHYRPWFAFWYVLLMPKLDQRCFRNCFAHRSRIENCFFFANGCIETVEEWQGEREKERMLFCCKV